MNRKPVYSKDNDQYRLASLPGGMWQLQKHDGTKGFGRGWQKDEATGKELPHNDPWKPIRRVTSFLEASMQMHSLVPKVRNA